MSRSQVRGGVAGEHGGVGEERIGGTACRFPRPAGRRCCCCRTGAAPGPGACRVQAALGAAALLVPGLLSLASRLHVALLGAAAEHQRAGDGARGRLAAVHQRSAEIDRRFPLAAGGRRLRRPLTAVPALSGCGLSGIAHSVPIQPSPAATDGSVGPTRCRTEATDLDGGEKNVDGV